MRTKERSKKRAASSSGSEDAPIGPKRRKIAVQPAERRPKKKKQTKKKTFPPLEGLTVWKLQPYVKDQPYLETEFRKANPGRTLDKFPQCFAVTRQQLSHTFYYVHNTYQTGAYYKDGILLSLLMKQELGIRSVISATEVITRLPGGQGPGDGGKFVPNKSKDEDDHHVKSFREAIASKRNIMLFLGAQAGNIHSHLVNFPPGVNFCPMAMARPLALIPERVNGILSYLVELEVLNPEDSWWVDKETRLNDLENTDDEVQMTASQCGQCGEHSKFSVYTTLRLCVNPDCPGVGTDELRAPNLNASLQQTDALLQRSIVSDGDRNTPLNLPDTAAILKDAKTEEDAGNVKDSSLDTGIICANCTNCVLRTAFHRWKCQTPNCPFELIRAPSLEAMLECLQKEKKYEDPEVHADYQDLVKVYSLGTHEGCEAHLVDLENDCFLLHLFEPKALGEAKGGTDEQYEQICNLARDGSLALEKGVVPKHAFGYEWWSTNLYRAYGNQYRFGYNYPHFDDGLPEEKKSFEHLSERRKTGLTIFDIDESINEPNERMLTGYLAGQYLKPHVDNDTAPPIVTRDLGDSAHFEIHIDKDWYFSTDKSGDPGSDDAPERGTFRDIKFREAWAKLRMGTADADTAGYTAAKTKILKVRSKRNTGSMVLRWKTHHGSVMFMIGRRIQEIYKHGVMPDGFRIAQIARYVVSEEAEEVPGDGDMGKKIRNYLQEKSLKPTAAMRIVKNWGKKDQEVGKVANNDSME